MTRIAAIAACFLFGTTQGIAAEADIERLDEARSLWLSSQSGDYRFSYQKYCDCNREAPPLTVVTVAGGRIQSVHHEYSYSDDEVPAREGSLDLYWTMAELFDKLARAMAGDAVVRAEYDATLGYPTSLYIDYDPTFIGDETDLRTIRLETR